jgi:hypothetical protein
MEWLKLGRAVSALLIWVTLGGCALGTFHDAISTRLDVEGVELTERYVVSKRFKFERDVEAADRAVLERGWLSIEGGQVDLSSLSRVRIFGIEPGTEARVLLMEGGDFRPGDTYKDLGVVFSEDLRQMVTDQRVNLEWEIEPNQLFRGWEDVGALTLRFGITLEIEVAN